MHLILAELLEAHAAGKIASLIGVEGGHMIVENAAILRQLYELGTRYLTLTWNCNTIWYITYLSPPAL